MCKNSSLVSVLIPAYNHENYIQETIKSIINQTYKNIELIIIDDGSKDSTWEKIQELKDECEKRFTNVIFQTKGNEGTCKTLNKLLSFANGEYVYRIASDDIAMPNAIEKEVEFLSNNKDFALCVGNNQFIDKNSNICYWTRRKYITYNKTNAKYNTFGDYLQRHHLNFNSSDFGSYSSLIKGNYIPNGYLIRKSIFDIIGHFTPEAPLEDWWLMLQISKYSKMKYIDEILFSYRWHDTNTVKSKDKMEFITEKTRTYEKENYKNIKRENLLPNIYEIMISIQKKGIIYKRQGIPYILEVLSYRQDDKKYKVLNLCGLKIKLT